MKKKQKNWIKFRHRVVRNIAFAILAPYSKWKYGIKVEKFKEQGDRPYLVLYNHQTAFDQFFVGMAFKGPIYYMASEDIFSKKDFEKITFTKNELKAIIKELCPTVVFEGEKVISSVKRDEENRCLYITVGNSALSAESLVKRLSVPSLFFNVEETEDTVAFYPFVN